MKEMPKSSRYGKHVLWRVAANIRSSILQSLILPGFISKAERFPLTVVVFLFIAVSISAQELPSANGVYGGVDALGRELSVNKDGVPELRKDRYIGLFYFTWLAQHGKNGPYDISKIVAGHPEAVRDPKHPAWGPLNAFHHWGESIFGYYTSDDAWVQRKHVQMLTDAGVDFLIFDATNAFPYTDQVLSLCSILDEYRKQGWTVPKIVFYTNSSSGATIQKIYESVYKKNPYPELWFQWEGKPLIAGHPEECSEELKNFFRIKKSQWPNEGKFHDDGFPWMAFEHPQHVFKNEKGENEVVNVSVAQHNGTIRFSSGALYGSDKNRTRSFHAGKNDPDPKAYLYGYNFAEQFEYAVKQDPKIIFVTGWNEWIAMRFNGPADEPIAFVDLCDANNSRDIEPMRGGYGDNYYMQMIEYIRRYKGAPAPQRQKTSVTIDIAGGFEQWDKVETVYRDYVGDIVDRDAPGYGDLHYTNKTGRNDFELMKIASDKDNVYFFVQTVKPIVLPKDFEEEHRLSLFLRYYSLQRHGALLETESWHGYEHCVSVSENGVSSVPSGPQDSIAEGLWLAFRLEDNRLHLSMPKKWLGGLSKPLCLEFKWADNYRDEIDSFYTDGDAAPIGRLNYVFSE